MMDVLKAMNDEVLLSSVDVLRIAKQFSGLSLHLEMFEDGKYRANFLIEGGEADGGMFITVLNKETRGYNFFKDVSSFNAQFFNCSWRILAILSPNCSFDDIIGDNY